MTKCRPSVAQLNGVSLQREFDAEKQQIAKHFGHSANSYCSVAQLQQVVGQQMLNRLADEKPEMLLDLGCGPGLFTGALQQQSRHLISADLSAEMLNAHGDKSSKVQADSHHLPFVENAFDAIFSSLMIQWCDISSVLNECYRVLKPGGKLFCSTLIQGSLSELEQSWAQVDDDCHVHQYLSLEDVSQASTQAQWQGVQLEQQHVVFHFNSVRELAKELKQLGANYVKNRQQKGLMTKSKWQAMEQHYRQMFAGDKGFPASYQVVYFYLSK